MFGFFFFFQSWHRQNRTRRVRHDTLEVHVIFRKLDRRLLYVVTLYVHLVIFLIVFIRCIDPHANLYARYSMMLRRWLTAYYVCTLYNIMYILLCTLTIFEDRIHASIVAQNKRIFASFLRKPCPRLQSFITRNPDGVQFFGFEYSWYLQQCLQLFDYRSRTESVPRLNRGPGTSLFTDIYIYKYTYKPLFV